MASGGGPARWNPRSQQWEYPQVRPEAQPTGADSGLPPRPAYPPGRAAAGTAGTTAGAPGTPAGAVGAPPGEAGDPAEAVAGAADAGADPAGAPSGRRRVRRWVAVAASLGLVLLLGGSALAGWLLLRTDPPAVPSGYQVVHDTGAGFRVAVPGDWQLSSSESGSGAGAVFRPAGGGTAFLQVFEVTGGPANACEVLVEGTRALSARDGYRRLSLTTTPGPGCELVHELPDTPSGDTGRGIGRLVVAPDGSRWVLMAYGPAAEAASVRTRITAALASFRRE
ncbi:hypothetical protein AB0B01_02900 [Streptomyces sp. NPDC044571]|uniref:hypothetical protein n=1 Tax=Streptomyces sp. NPDC044571 TaxID=3155371 RepID=UPI0033EA12B1